MNEKGLQFLPQASPILLDTIFQPMLDGGRQAYFPVGTASVLEARKALPGGYFGMGISNTIYRGRARTVEDAIEEWKRNSEEVKDVRVVEALAAEWCRVVEALSVWQRELWESLRAGKLADVLKAGSALEKAYRFSDELHQAINEAVECAETKGYTVDGSDQFRKMAAQLTTFTELFQAKWPKVDAKEIEKGLEHVKRGEVTSISGWIDELHRENKPKC